MKRILFSATLLAGLALPLCANAEGFGLGVRAGTLGAGVEGTIGLSERINLRLGANNYTYSFDDTYDDVRYDADLELKNAALILDWHPFAGGFRLSAGILSNDNGADLEGTPTGVVSIGDNDYPAAAVGTLNGKVSFKSSAPYVGLGWGNAVAKNKGFGVNFEIGALFQGSPDVELSSTSGLVPQTDLDQEAQEIEDDLKNLEVYPVVSFGVSYGF
jgi:hypothetical protein